jgi:hypothetical protein
VAATDAFVRLSRKIPSKTVFRRFRLRVSSASARINAHLMSCFLYTLFVCPKPLLFSLCSHGPNGDLLTNEYKFFFENQALAMQVSPSLALGYVT